ncbi:hypothetical protein I553_0513 [Mycobacterium xenopi 4042]|uniref:Uncharacterized protein n=1 Tax=Mycobacterium xenopi 4042 TaxID=1299334 RepID=X7YHT6_MYCXE|nr:hypothetical protein I553_0513 [Mycobacterium xenopi 4042]
MTLLRLQPIEVVSAEALQLPLWGGLGEEDRLRARRALVRVQGCSAGGGAGAGAVRRSRARRTHYADAAGRRAGGRADPRRPWPGQLPEPSPTVLLDDPVELLDAQGNPVRVTNRGCSRLIRHG